MFKTVKKINSALKGSIIIPADKSISHRAIMLASIANGSSKIINISNSMDCLSTINIFKQLGIDIEFENKKTIKIIGDKLKQSTDFLNAGNSGTTIRLVSGILARQQFNSTIIGDESLSKRPMKRILEPLKLMGANISSIDGKAPLYIKGTQLYGIEYNSLINSAQVKSCVLLAGLGAEGHTKYTEQYLSRNHTELMLKYLGANIETKNNTTIIYPSELTSKNIEIVGDISSASFFIVAGLIIKNSDFVIKNVGINPTRTGIFDILKRMQANIKIFNEHTVSGELCADIRVRYTENLKACEISGQDIPKLIDELPILAVLASQADGTTIIKNAEDLRNKETDRITCLVKELQKIGVDIFEQKDGYIVHGNGNKKYLNGDAELDVYMDHRLAMSFYVAGLICKKEILIKDFNWINISFPEFENLFNNLIS